MLAGADRTKVNFAAQIVDAEMDLHLYGIDPSKVVSKYIGETEKSLGIVFDAVNTFGALLLLNEGDCLFGKVDLFKSSVTGTPRKTSRNSPTGY